MEEDAISQKTLRRKRIGNLAFVLRMYSPLWILIIFLDVLVNLLYFELRGAYKWDPTNPFQAIIPLIRLTVIPLTQFIHRRISTYYGIDLQKNKLISEAKSERRFETLFSSEAAFHRFQQDSYDLMTDPRFSLLAFAMGLCIILVEWTSGSSRDIISGLMTPGELGSWSIDLALIFFYFVFDSVYWAGSFAGLLMFFQITQTIRNIGQRDIKDLSIYKFESFDFSQPIEYDNRYEIVKFSIKQFRRHAKIIASFPIPFAIITVFVALQMNILYFGLTIVPYLEGEVLFSDIYVSLVMTLALNVLFAAVCFALFFYPQNTLRKIINDRKEKTIFEFETFYELKLMQWIQILERTDASEEKTRLEKEMSILSDKIDELSRISGWPFDIKQALAVVGTAFFPIISFIASVIVTVTLYRMR